MLTPPTIITASTTISAAAAQSGVSISALPAPTASDYTLCVKVSALSSATGIPTAMIGMEDSVDAFTNNVPRALFSFYGPITQDVTKKLRVTSDTPSARIGTASATMRSKVYELTGGTPSLTFTTWVE